MSANCGTLKGQDWAFVGEDFSRTPGHSKLRLYDGSISSGGEGGGSAGSHLVDAGGVAEGWGEVLVVVSDEIDVILE